MIQSNDHLRRRSLNSFHRLDSLVLRETNPDAWNGTVLIEALDVLKRWQAIDDSGDEEKARIFVDLYRLAYRARVFRIPKEYFFWLVAIRLRMEAQIGPDALVHQRGYLGPLWERRDAIWKKHGWPEEDDDGDPWSPEGHLDRVPDDYAAWSGGFERTADQMGKAAFRAVCEKHGVPEIADLEENDPAEWERRWRIGSALGREFGKEKDA